MIQKPWLARTEVYTTPSNLPANIGYIILIKITTKTQVTLISKQFIFKYNIYLKIPFLTIVLLPKP